MAYNVLNLYRGHVLFLCKWRQYFDRFHKFHTEFHLIPGQTQQLVFTPPSADKAPSTVMSAMMTELQWSITVGRSFRRMTSCWPRIGILHSYCIQFIAALLAWSYIAWVGLGDRQIWIISYLEKMYVVIYYAFFTMHSQWLEQSQKRP